MKPKVFILKIVLEKWKSCEKTHFLLENNKKRIMIRAVRKKCNLHYRDEIFLEHTPNGRKAKERKNQMEYPTKKNAAVSSTNAPSNAIAITKTEIEAIIASNMEHAIRTLTASFSEKLERLGKLIEYQSGKSEEIAKSIAEAKGEVRQLAAYMFRKPAANALVSAGNPGTGTEVGNQSDNRGQGAMALGNKSEEKRLVPGAGVTDFLAGIEGKHKLSEVIGLNEFIQSTATNHTLEDWKLLFYAYVKAFCDKTEGLKVPSVLPSLTRGAIAAKIFSNARGSKSINSIAPAPATKSAAKKEGKAISADDEVIINEFARKFEVRVSGTNSLFELIHDIRIGKVGLNDDTDRIDLDTFNFIITEAFGKDLRDEVVPKVLDRFEKFLPMFHPDYKSK